MTMTFHDSQRLPSLCVIGFAGPSGSGKSYTALRFARGLAGPDPFYFIDTENGKGERLYGDQFQPWKSLTLEPPYTPERFLEAIDAAVKDGAKVIVADSISDEHEGDGGLLDIQEAYLQEKAGDNYGRREAYSFPAWKEAKGRHKRLVREIRAPRCHLILCMRAQDKIELVKNDKGKLEAIPKRTLTGVNGWEPICEKRLPYECFASLLMLPDKPGVPIPIKLPDPYRPFIQLDKQIDEETGAAIAKWSGGVPPGTAPAQATTRVPALSEDMFEQLKTAKAEASVSNDWMREQLSEIGMLNVPAQITLATIKRLTEPQGLELLSRLSAKVDETLAAEA